MRYPALRRLGRMLPICGGLLLLAQACADKGSAASPAPQPKGLWVEKAGPYPVANTTITLTDWARGRKLTVEIWYPAAESARAGAESGEPIANFVTQAADKAAWADLVAKAEHDGITRQTRSLRGGPPADDGKSWPLILFSHCMNCVRFSTFSVAQQLASRGMVVMAPDHRGGTLFDSLEGHSASLGPEFLEVRAADIGFVLDTALTDNTQPVPQTLRARIDKTRIGMYGHSFGGATTGLVLNRDTRVKAGMAFAVPMENPLLPGPVMSAIHVPVFFLLAKEDNMIYEIGNKYIRDNFAKAAPPAWKAEVADAGHMSFTDICGINASYHAGCGQDSRQTFAGERFTYLDITVARGIAMAYATAFFEAHLNANAEALAYLDQPRPKASVEIQSKH